jgi:choline dehydrogenase-like flavoprotein
MFPPAPPRPTTGPDYVIVGMGSAAECVLASHLSANRRRVLLLESGDADTGRWLC